MITLSPMFTSYRIIECPPMNTLFPMVTPPHPNIAFRHTVHAINHRRHDVMVQNCHIRRNIDVVSQENQLRFARQLCGSYQQLSPIDPNTPLFFRIFARATPFPQKISRIKIHRRRKVKRQKCTFDCMLIFGSSSVSNSSPAGKSWCAQKRCSPPSASPAWRS